MANPDQMKSRCIGCGEEFSVIPFHGERCPFCNGIIVMLSSIAEAVCQEAERVKTGGQK